MKPVSKLIWVKRSNFVAYRYQSVPLDIACVHITAIEISIFTLTTYHTYFTTTISRPNYKLIQDFHNEE